MYLASSLPVRLFVRSVVLEKVFVVNFLRFGFVGISNDRRRRRYKKIILLDAFKLENHVVSV